MVGIGACFDRFGAGSLARIRRAVTGLEKQTVNLGFLGKFTALIQDTRN